MPLPIRSSGSSELRVAHAISDRTERLVFCCKTSTREAMVCPWQTSRTRSCIRSQARIADISLSLNGVFSRTSLRLFHDSRER